MSMPSINIRPLVGSTWTNFSYRVSDQPRDRAYKSKDTHRKGGLAASYKEISWNGQKKKPRKSRTCPTQQTHAFTSLQGKRNIVQNGRQIRSIFNFQVFDGDQGIVVRTGRPVRRDTVGFYNSWRLLRKREAFHLVNSHLQISSEKRPLTIRRCVRRSCVTSDNFTTANGICQKTNLRSNSRAIEKSKAR